MTVRIQGDSSHSDSSSSGGDAKNVNTTSLPNENEDSALHSHLSTHSRSQEAQHMARVFPIYTCADLPRLMPCHAANLIGRVLRVIPRHVVLRTRHRRQVPVDVDPLHAEEVLAHEADLSVDVGRVLGVVVLQREAVAVVHEAL